MTGRITDGVSIRLLFKACQGLEASRNCTTFHGSFFMCKSTVDSRAPTIVVFGIPSRTFPQAGINSYNLEELLRGCNPVVGLATFARVTLLSYHLLDAGSCIYGCASTLAWAVSSLSHCSLCVCNHSEVQCSQNQKLHLRHDRCYSLQDLQNRASCQDIYETRPRLALEVHLPGTGPEILART